ncbi:MULTISPECIES: hypothetical protein [unclassified Microbacterium]|uniref:hypothetical protein n=1 Tax=unclassified Microbacterium TaxID=2609290 RepID=UPI003016335C
MTAALDTLRKARRAARGSLDVARRSHALLVAECNQQIEASASAVNLATRSLDELDAAIELLEGESR